MSTTISRRIGYGIGLFGLAIAFFYTIPATTPWQVVDKNTAISWGIGLVAIGLAIIAMSNQRDSDRRMQSMANLEFYEKMSMIQLYLACLSTNSAEHDEADAQRVLYDLESARQLEGWMKRDSKVAIDFKTNIKLLRDKAKERGKSLLSRKLDDFLAKYKS